MRQLRRFTMLVETKVHAPELYEPRRNYRSKQRDAYFRENRGIDAAILADELGVTERFVQMYQRKIGVRKLRQNPRKGDAHD
jgi:hypothetical protein